MAPISHIQDNASERLADSDYQVATQIAKSLKQNELASGQEFSAKQIGLIRVSDAEDDPANKSKVRERIES